MKKRILICGRFAPESIAYLTQFQEYEVMRVAQPSEVTPALLSSSSALIIRSNFVITDKILQQASGVQVIVSATSGFDHMDLEATQKWGITVMYTPQANVDSVTQFTWSFILQSQSKMFLGQKNLKAGGWKDTELLGNELRGRTLGLVGLGRIGKQVSQLGRWFGMHLVAYDPYISEAEFRINEVERLSYEELLKVADIISFHVPKTKETTNMLNRSHFEYINRGVAIINTSRGGLIQEDDLVEALRSGAVSFAGLDVFSKEPLSRDSQLLQLPQVMLTPHMAAMTEDAFFKSSQMAAEKVVKFLREGLAQDVLPPKEEWYREDQGQSSQ